MHPLVHAAFEAMAAVLSLNSSAREVGCPYKPRMRRADNPQRQSVRAAMRRASKSRRIRKAARTARKINRSR